jgi:type I restriction enzyme, S subunit
LNSEVSTLRLKDCLSLLKDGTHNPPERSEKGIKFIAGATDIKYLHVNFSKCTFVSQENYKIMHKKWEPKVNDVLLTIVGTVGNTAIVREQDLPFTMQRSIATLRPNEKIDFRYLFYWLNSNEAKWAISSRITATGQPGIYLGELGKIPISIPRLEVQKKISEKLYLLDQAISINKKIVEVIENKLNALFRSWFIDFDPVKAKAEGKLSYGIDEVTAALFPDTFEDSEFGPIPTGWRVGTINEFGKIVTGGTPSSKNPEHFDGLVPFITIPDLARNIWQEETERTISQEGATSLKSRLIPPGSVCVSCIATVGNVGITTRPSITNQQIHSIVCNKGYSSQFVYSLITSFVPNLKFFAGGGAVIQNISKSTFGKQRVIIPPIQVVEQFTKLVEPLYQSIKAKNSASRSILEARDALLPRLMSGELKVN